MAVLAAIAIAATVASTALGVYSDLKQAKAAKKVSRLRQQQERLRVRRERRGAIRQAQIKRAMAENVAFAEGAGIGSGISGGLSSLGSQLGSGLGYSTQGSNLSNDIFSTQRKAISSAAKFGAIQSGLGMVSSAASYGAKAGWGQGGTSPSYTTTGGEGAGSGSAGGGYTSDFRYPGNAY